MKEFLLKKDLMHFTTKALLFNISDFKTNSSKIVHRHISKIKELLIK